MERQSSELHIPTNRYEHRNSEDDARIIAQFNATSATYPEHQLGPYPLRISRSRVARLPGCVVRRPDFDVPATQRESKSTSARDARAV